MPTDKDIPVASKRPPDIEQPREAVSQAEPDPSRCAQVACYYCTTLIPATAKVCRYCTMYQSRIWNHLSQLGIAVSIGVLALSIWQFKVAQGQRTKAEEALQRASAVEQLAKQTQSLLDFNLLLTKAMGDDRKAFDELWTLSQAPQYPYQDLARRAAETIGMSSTTIRQDPALVEQLQKRDYDETLLAHTGGPLRHPPAPTPRYFRGVGASFLRSLLLP